jgi:oligopeptide transport system ATP-binding protein
MAPPALIRLDDVSVVFAGGVRALDGVSLSLQADEVIGLVGESGSGKTTLCRVLMGLTAPTCGSVAVEGEPLDVVLRRRPLAFHRRTQMLLQDAVASLSPRMTIRALIAEPIRIHGLPFAEAWPHALALMSRLGLSPDVLEKFPHQVSGGQARRVAIARALILEPRLIVADEPTAGLDLSVQGELLNLLLDLQREFRLTYLIVSHNLNVVRRITDRTAVMYLGQIVEEAPTRSLFAAPAHPYTAALLSTIPAIDPANRGRPIVLEGEIPSPTRPPSGCRFHTRCPQAQHRCSAEPPVLRPIGAGRQVRCHYPLVSNGSAVENAAGGSNLHQQAIGPAGDI